MSQQKPNTESIVGTDDSNVYKVYHFELCKPKWLFQDDCIAVTSQNINDLKSCSHVDICYGHEAMLLALTRALAHNSLVTFTKRFCVIRADVGQFLQDVMYKHGNGYTRYLEVVLYPYAETHRYDLCFWDVVGEIKRQTIVLAVDNAVFGDVIHSADVDIDAGNRLQQIMAIQGL